MQKQNRKSIWSIIIKIIIAVATAVGSVLGIQSCI
ncbi:MAG: smalltalk protein [Phocaeicola sp.]|nr:smalltalk protein [Phocaeicola sp.]MDE5678401.1 smalltalk protein [Phocaeicola sp.]MDE6179954.1 smalltalk protein [Phocaeicola sp.]